MKKLFSILLLFLLTVTVTACNAQGDTVCQHRDANDNGKCDKCIADYTDGADKKICQHRDINDDGKCDRCDSSYFDGSDATHLHSFGNWILYGDETNTPCQNRLFYRTCPSCGNIQWKNGGYESHTFQTVTIAPTCTAEGYDEKTCSSCGLVEKVNPKPAEHSYKTTYTTNASFHWLDCEDCDATKSYAEHIADVSGSCTVCGQPILPTEGIVYDLSANGTYAEVIGYTGTATRILIADTYQGVPVKTIYQEAFKNSDITEVIIPDSVTSISSYAFSNCTSLTSVTIPDSVTSIGYDAFYWCTSLTSVTIGDSVTSIGYDAFHGCSGLTNVTIPDSVTSIGYGAFSGCNSALYTEYEYGKYVGNSENPYQVLIEVTNKNLSTYKIHEDTKIIADSAFSSCARLTSITIPDSVTSIGYEAFSDCSGLTSVYYKGTAEKWSEISIGDWNYNLKNATRYYYSETTPTEEGNYWHYNAEGKIEIWP